MDAPPFSYTQLALPLDALAAIYSPEPCGIEETERNPGLAPSCHDSVAFFHVS